MLDKPLQVLILLRHVEEGASPDEFFRVQSHVLDQLQPVVLHLQLLITAHSVVIIRSKPGLYARILIKSVH